METKTTPGIWFISQDKRKINEHGSTMIQIDTDDMYTGIASFYYQANDKKEQEMAEADARLFCASKEMLECLKESLSMMEQTLIHRENAGFTIGNIFLESTIKSAKEIIKKATE